MLASAFREPRTRATSPAVTLEARFPQLDRMNVSSCATSSLDNRQPKPGMPKGDGAAVVPGRALPANTKRMREFGSCASTEELPAIFGSAVGLPAPSVWWQAEQLSSYSSAPRSASCPFASAAAVAGFAANFGASPAEGARVLR